MPFIKLSDGTVAHVRMGKRGAKPSEADIKALEAVRDALQRRCVNCDWPAAECKLLNAEQRKCCPDCHHPAAQDGML